MAKIEITDITIKIGQKKVTLSPEQAHELKDALEALLGGPEPKVVERIIERQPWRWWYVNVPYTQPARWEYNTWIDNITTSNDAGSYTLTLAQ